jgi:DNA-packaging protein gp3
MPKPSFNRASELSKLINAYFIHIEGMYHLEEITLKDAKGLDHMEQKVWDREPEPPTISGLALFLGFNSREAFDNYEQKGKFANTLKRGRLRVETIYEKKLHQPAPTGALFALKSMGWNEKPESKTTDIEPVKSLKIEIIEAGPKPAENEAEVAL